MKIKALSASILSVALTASTASAQSSTSVSAPASGVNAPASSVSFTPSIGTGMRTHLIGNFTNGKKDANTVGAYVTPGFELDYKGETFSFNLAYELEMSSAQAFGTAVSSDNKGFADNSYVMNHPVIVASMKLSPSLKLNNLTEMAYFLHSDNDAGYRTDGVVSDTRTLDVTSILDLEYKINDRLSLATGYRIDFGHDIGLVGGAGYAAALKNPNDANNQNAIKAAIAASPNAGEEPDYVMNSSFTTAKIKLADKASFKTSAMIGYVTEDGETTSNSYYYRSNSDLTLTQIKDLELALRYRLVWIEPKGAGEGIMQNLGRVIANYAINSNWTATLTNTMKVTDPTANGAQTSYNNETYLGAIYKF